MSFGSRLRELRETKALRQEDLGRLFTVGKSAVSQWENDIRVPDINIIIKIARYFECSVDYLFGISDDRYYSSSSMVKLPLLGQVHKDLLLLDKNNIQDYLDVPVYLSADFILKISDDSMIGAGILEGDLALCRASAEPKPGQIIAVRENTAGQFVEISLRYYFKEAGKAVLKSANPYYPDIDYQANSCTAIGQLASLIRLDAPGYEIYTDYLTIKDEEEWMGVIEAASEYGLSPQDILASVNIQAKILKRLKTP